MRFACLLTGPVSKSCLLLSRWTKAWLIALTLILPAQWCSAVPFVYEPFFYHFVGSNLVMVSGSGLVGYNWYVGGVGAELNASVIYSSTGLTWPGLCLSGGSAYSLGSTAGRGITRELNSPIGTDGTTVYASFLFRPDGISTTSPATYAGLVLETGGPDHLFIGRVGAGLGSFVMETLGGTGQVVSNVTPTSGTVVLCVVKMEFGAGPGGNDRFTLYVNPPLTSEPATGVVKTDLNLGMITDLGLLSTGAYRMDEIRLATTYAEALPTPLARAYEGFNYPAGPVTSQVLAGGTGFSEIWHLGGYYGTVGPHYQIAADSLTYPGLLTSPGRFTCTATPSPQQTSGMTRTFSGGIGTTGTTRYLSFLMRPEGVIGQGSSGGWFGIGLESRPEPTFFVGRSGAAGLYRLEDRGGANGVDSSVVPTLGETIFAVLKMEFGIGPGGNDRMTLYINPVPGAAEPTNGLVKENSNYAIMQSVTLYSNGAYSADEIRLGDTYASVTPPNTPISIHFSQPGGPPTIHFFGQLQSSTDLVNWITLPVTSPYTPPAGPQPGSGFYRSTP
jgi:uncharacterized spore protein YtfJ